jgi:hypothetical protein
MIDWLRKNITLLTVGIGLIGSVLAGLQQTADIVDSIRTVDERMYSLEEQFWQLQEDTMVSNDIAILYEKIYQLEQANYENEYLSERVLLLEENYNDLVQKMYDLEYLEERVIYLESNQYNDSGSGIEEWDFDNLKDRVLVLETQWNDKWWKFDNYDDRLDYLESEVFGW